MTPPSDEHDRSHLTINRARWQQQSREYDRRFRRVLGGARAEAWGLWRRPERALRLLPPVRGRLTLEVGCGAARWSIALAARGARAVGLDFSRAQLEHARRELRTQRARVALVEGSVERIPPPDGTFDLVFCDWGALTFADPLRAVPECARVLRPGGHFVFATASPFQIVARDRRTDRLGRRLRTPYFGMHRVEFPGEVNFQLGYGAWIELFASQGLTVERLVETQPSAGSRSAYLRPHEERWAQHWPMECLWRLRKEGAPRRRPTPPAGSGGGRRPGSRAPAVSRGSPRARARAPRSAPGG